ncbi:MAG: DNA-processing protein DprA, partial [Pseudomonadota bacterium]
MSEIAPEELIARLRLIRTRHVGPITYHELLDTYGSAFQAIDTLPDLARRGGSRTALTLHSKTQAEDEIADLKRLGGSLLCHDQGAYPALLKAIDPPPPLLFARGRMSLLREPMLAMVGARNASTNGRRFASRLAAGLGEAGFVIASGLARGIDAAAHRGALPTGTVAVLGGGLDQIYPPENTDLYGEIAATGVVLSERPLGHVGRAQDFPRRNRIISGMALGTLVVEAALRSGSLITARFAGEQGREVFAVPGSPLDERCRGT